MAALTVSKARETFSDMVNRAAYAKERVVVARRGKVVAAVVPVEDLELLQELEERIDLVEARASLVEAKKKGTKSLRTLKKELGF